MNSNQNVSGLAVSGLTEIALGAQTGWLMALAVSQPDQQWCWETLGAGLAPTPAPLTTCQ